MCAKEQRIQRADYKFFLSNFILFIYLLAALGLRCYAWDFSLVVASGGHSVAVHGLLIAVASLVVEHRL